MLQLGMTQGDFLKLVSAIFAEPSQQPQQFSGQEELPWVASVLKHTELAALFGD